jgi:hypothetical protein
MQPPGILIQCKNLEIGLARFTNFVRYVNRALRRIILGATTHLSASQGVLCTMELISSGRPIGVSDIKGGT